MSRIDILGGDWRINFDDEFDSGASSTAVKGLKSLKHISGTGTVTANALYSAIADAMDELNSMDDENPMLPTTPNAYTLENEYFMDDLSSQFVTGGAISSVNWANEIWCKVVSGGTNFIGTDIGLEVLETVSGDTGTLLDFETLPDGTEVIWIRAETSGDTFDSTSSTIEVVTDGGTGTRTVAAVATTGEQLWSNLNVIGGIAGDAADEAEVFIIQDRIKLTQFWVTDPTASGGIVDALIRMNDSITAAFPIIALGIVEVFNRRYGSTYDNFALDVSAGGTSSLPLATAPDLNNTTGYRSASFDGGAGTMLLGELMTDTTNPGRFGVVTQITDGGATGTFEYYLVGNLVDFSDGDNFTTPNGKDAEIDGATAANTGGPTDATAGAGGTVTVEFGINDVDHDGDGNTEPYSLTIDAQGDVSTEEVYERLKYITRRGASAADLFTAVQISQAGEQFRGLQLQAQTGATGSFTEGDDITNETEATGVQAGIVLGVNSVDTYVTLTDTSGAFAASDSLDDEGSDTVVISGSPTVIVPVKASPFGTLAGGTFFGARGVVLVSPASGDEQDATLVDDDGVVRVPPNTVSVEITNLVDQDVVFVADAAGVGVIDKDRFGGMAAAAIGDDVITVGTSIDGDVPQSGFIRVVDANANPIEEQRYRYSARTSTVFTLVSFGDGGSLVADGGGNGTTLVDAAGSFDSKDIIFGDLIRNITDGADVASIVSRDSDTQLTTTQLVGGATNDWATGDVYEIGSIMRVYTTADNIYAPILDRRVESGDGDAINNGLVQSSPFNIVVNVRQGKIILPFTQNTSVESNGRSLSVIRNTDTIAT